MSGITYARIVGFVEVAPRGHYTLGRLAFEVSASRTGEPGNKRARAMIHELAAGRVLANRPDDAGKRKRLHIYRDVMPLDGFAPARKRDARDVRAHDAPARRTGAVAPGAAHSPARRPAHDDDAARAALRASGRAVLREPPVPGPMPSEHGSQVAEHHGTNLPARMAPRGRGPRAGTAFEIKDDLRLPPGLR